MYLVNFISMHENVELSDGLGHLVIHEHSEATSSFLRVLHESNAGY